MAIVLDGTPAAEGIALGRVFLLDWGIPLVPHRAVPPEEADREIGRFEEARAWARERLLETQRRAEERLGRVEARIFDPQILMLDDPEVVDGTVRYIRDHRLTAERAFEWRMLELQAQWSRTSHPMVLDRLNDLEDLMIRVLNRLLGKHDPMDIQLEHDAVVVAENLTPSLVVQLDRERVAAFATDKGTRTAHWAILARSLEIPAVVGLGDVTKHAREGQQAVVDGRIGRVILDPDEDDLRHFQERVERLRAWAGELELIAELEPVTRDGQFVELRANLDQPEESEEARRYGADGVGLFRTEFLVVGRHTMPGEEEQYEAYRHVAEAFAGGAVYIRTFDLGGDKFPMFLHMPQEENPFLGWRAIRVCLDEPALFRTQLRALLRATAHGDVRIMLPLVNEVEEVRQVRALLQEEEHALEAAGVPFNPGYKLGVMIETPAAALEADQLAPHADFFSIGTNDLVQYTLAVDRTNARLARLYKPFHPAVLRQLKGVARAGRAAGIEVSVCGEMASNPLAAFLLIGLDITTLSMAWPSLPEIKQFVRSIRAEDARRAAQEALQAPTGEDVTRVLSRHLADTVDLSMFEGKWSLSLSP